MKKIEKVSHILSRVPFFKIINFEILPGRSAHRSRKRWPRCACTTWCAAIGAVGHLGHPHIDRNVSFSCVQIIFQIWADARDRGNKRAAIERLDNPLTAKQVKYVEAAMSVLMDRGSFCIELDKKVNASCHGQVKLMAQRTVDETIGLLYEMPDAADCAVADDDDDAGDCALSIEYEADNERLQIQHVRLVPTPSLRACAATAAAAAAAAAAALLACSLLSSLFCFLCSLLCFLS
eukprot:SAG11_NODE_777_length_7218_cov_24.269420_11_plen_235_part_00